jgi:transcriptional regulator with PAS, ATPase and Fis domain
LQEAGLEVTSTSDEGFALKLFEEGGYFLALLEHTEKLLNVFKSKLSKNPKMNAILLLKPNTSNLICPYEMGFLGQFKLDKTDAIIAFIKNYKRTFDQWDLKMQTITKEKVIKADEPVFASKVMMQIIEKAEKVAKTQSSVLITGESGTGKEVIAKLLHEKSLRNSHPFVAINSAAIAPNLLESELFGYEKGAFTGAFTKKMGKFEYANFGTIFLDEIGETPLELQAKLLRVIQEREFERVGGLETIKINVRLIAATNQNLEEAVKSKRFREDLFYRLNVVPIHIPPLRERTEDILPLSEYFLSFYAKKNGINPLNLSQEAIKKLLNYNWPGNVRELSNVIERATVLSSGSMIYAQDLLLEQSSSDEIGDIELEFNLESLEKKTILKALEKTEGNKTLAAKLLGLSVKTLRSKVQ